jgi:ABC-type multidrug transport system fused ATPase/permease subunit
MGFSFRSSPRRTTETPDIRQGEHAECGLAALGILLGHHGVHLSLGELRQRAGSTLLGSTLRQLRQIAEDEGFTTSARRAEPSDLETLGLPLIAHMRFIHFAVVEKITRDTVHLNDPSAGPMTMTREEFSRDFTGIVLRLMPREPKRRGRPFSLVRSMTAAFRPDMAGFLFASVVAAISGALASVGFRELSGTTDGATIFATPLALSAVSLVGTFLLAALLAFGATNAARRRVMAHLGAAPDLHYLEARPDRTLAFLAALRALQQNGTPNAVLALIWTASLLAFSALAAPIQALPIAALSLAQAGAVLRTSLHRNGYAARFAKAVMPVRAMPESYLVDSAWYRIGRGTDFLFSWLAGTHAREASYVLKASEEHDARDAIVVMLDLCKVALPIGLSTWGLGSTDDLLFALIMAIASSAMLHVAASSLSIRPLKDTMLRLSDPPPEPTPMRPLPPTAPPAARLVMEDAGWSPSGMAVPIVSGLSLRLGAGEVAIAHGAPGAGATTFARLAAGLIEPTSGHVRLAGSALLIDHRRFLVPGTLRHNLSLGAPGIDEGTMQSALEAVEMGAVVAPRGGLDFILKTDQPRMSGGQIRRLMIARAVCRSPAVLVLDGALDNVETDLAGSILANLAKRGLAIVVTTKNLDLLRFADRPMELGDRA